MDRRRIVTTELTGAEGPARASALLAEPQVPAPGEGQTRRHLGAVDLDSGEVVAVAVVDVDAAGAARLRAVAGEAAALTGAVDALVALGARYLIAPSPIGDEDGWSELSTDPPSWSLAL